LKNSWRLRFILGVEMQGKMPCDDRPIGLIH
jgi:hypothetical protein